MTHKTPVHPGLVLKDELEEREISQTELARHIDVLPKTVNEICQKKRGISAEMAVKLAKAPGARLGTIKTVLSWLLTTTTLFKVTLPGLLTIPV